MSKTLKLMSLILIGIIFSFLAVTASAAKCPANKVCYKVELASKAPDHSVNFVLKESSRREFKKWGRTTLMPKKIRFGYISYTQPAPQGPYTKQRLSYNLQFNHMTRTAGNSITLHNCKVGPFESQNNVNHGLTQKVTTVNLLKNTCEVETVTNNKCGGKTLRGRNNSCLKIFNDNDSKILELDGSLATNVELTPPTTDGSKNLPSSTIKNLNAINLQLANVKIFAAKNKTKTIALNNCDLALNGASKIASLAGKTVDILVDDQHLTDGKASCKIIMPHDKVQV